MKATLEFNLPEDNEAFLLATDAGKYRTALLHVFYVLRRELKHADTPCTLEQLRTELAEYMRNNNVELV